ncbi:MULTISPECIES: pyridoxamine 5'-phosphate oxidase [Salinivibrio]|uniref:Pyridoxine/pyridoxamine 5'-phosphate oxidase n=1 Tax=Salinivibrio siamensis TaxID=414286 RepID=A0ABX3K9J1_9GAMM|nr:MULTISPECIES: pyridoxamine 5'-phosphate oxidase [Salinivibrio]KKA43483.1 pyridoxine 5'-phosphate oxidase [Salinivibrio sp. KP-1]MPS30846.1 pyridoxamine 5'-phosphate oxidase [Salinivibrio sp. VYel7]MPX89613.1 pyridoxamine 5'-phosphate oxidase [Salinivibrio sp. VYel1]MPX92247.1 pyridoxamine 5'-phosphate oxidase [Salinivibrio sp. VYel9]MPX97177.1 pyridoxamine 5'-phosphate oxidase [Salinivibrio sp. VYel6]
MELSDIRREYTQGGLRRDDLPDAPMDLFGQWLQQAIDTQVPDPTAMTVATVDEDGQPFQRIVLLKDFNQEGFVFYTNLGSRKALHLKKNSKISLHFPWHFIERQVHIMGEAEPLSKKEVFKYFTSRPKESQIAAWASKQSERLSARSALEGKFLELKKQFEKGEVPVPTFWGGYRIKPQSIEFWQGGEHRLHDRFLYQRQEGDRWAIERLAP